MNKEDKKLVALVWVGGALILLLTFGKLLWVKYFQSTHSGENTSLLELLTETVPLLLLAIGIGMFVAWMRNRSDKQ